MPDEAEKVHVVMGTAGEYSDCREWPIKAYLDLAAAQAHVDAATAYLQEKLPSGYIDYEERAAFCKNNPWDPDGDLECYSGASYFVHSVKLEGSPLSSTRTRAESAEAKVSTLTAALEAVANTYTPHADFLRGIARMALSPTPAPVQVSSPTVGGFQAGDQAASPPVDVSTGRS